LHRGEVRMIVCSVRNGEFLWFGKPRYIWFPEPNFVW
jgi:hypothetical protein